LVALDFLAQFWISKQLKIAFPATFEILCFGSVVRRNSRVAAELIRP
jgi:hypothetical protein